MKNVEEPIFDDCAVAFVPSDQLVPKLIFEFTRFVEQNGASVREPRRDGSLPLDKITHIISNTVDFPQYVESQAAMIPVVTTQWIKVSLAKQKQAALLPFSPDPRMIFSQVVVTCAGLPVMDKESIIGATMALGGQESKDVTRTTTHICALSVDDPKVAFALSKKLKCKVVLPHWFDDCFKLGKRIDEGPYLLPDAEILRKGADDEVDIPVSANLIDATSAKPQWVPLPPDGDGVRPPSTVFSHRRVLLSHDLSLSTRFTKIIKDIIVHGGGKVVDDVEDCHMFICQYRDGPQYIEAARACKEVGSLAWLFYLIVSNQWRNPLHRLLHYPIPRDGIPGFKDMRITISNYGGEARVYLENLITASGAVFTKTMNPENTHLITARNTSHKCAAAPEWGIAVVNHLWLEESYAKCEKKQINLSKYNHFPPRTNLGEIIGQTFLDESRLRQLYYPGGDEAMSPRAKRKREMLEAAEAKAYPDGPAEGLPVATAERDFDVMRDEADAGSSGGDRRRHRRRSKTKPAAAIETPLRPRQNYQATTDTPSVPSTGSRSAKAKAKDRLQGIAPDIALYEKEKKRPVKAGAPWGGKRAADQAERQQDEFKSAAKALLQRDDEARPVKKSRPSLPEVDMRIVVTAFDRWVGDSHKEDQDRRKLRDLGVQIVQEGQPCDYLVAPKVVRTVKFLCALSRGVTLLSTDFINVVLQSGEVPCPEDYRLKDKAAEGLYRMKISRSEARAKANRGRLLQSVPIYCTEKVRNGPDSYRAIAEANGAIFKLYRARSGTSIKPTSADEDGDGPPDPVYLLSNASPEERQLWPRFRAMAENGNMEARIVVPDWLLDVAMAQEVRFDDRFLVDTLHEGEGK
ncbi:BRCT domain-containing protein [Ophiocordyceps camponoti-floridani]|uniref:BRCT domain-containing protein n=1 Tax=Ophiocordyceps camponoti-floridani TaxID=2030778 RepID=A0A8H4QDX5_9HYPO|nr:BRCT domain-containing protein [Ophiocordyceps camponoti-floridani]